MEDADAEAGGEGMSRRAFKRGNSLRASERALIMKGRAVSFGGEEEEDEDLELALSRFRRDVSWVRSTSVV